MEIIPCKGIEQLSPLDFSDDFAAICAKNVSSGGLPIRVGQGNQMRRIRPALGT